MWFSHYIIQFARWLEYSGLHLGRGWDEVIMICIIFIPDHTHLLQGKAWHEICYNHAGLLSMKVMLSS